VEDDGSVMFKGSTGRKMSDWRMEWSCWLARFGHANSLPEIPCAEFSHGCAEKHGWAMLNSYLGFFLHLL